MKYDMKLISHDELKRKLERKDNFICMNLIHGVFLPDNLSVSA